MKKVQLVTEAPRRRRFSPDFKAEVVSEIAAGGLTTAEVCRKYELSQSLVYLWRKNFSMESPFTKIVAADPASPPSGPATISVPIRITSPHGVVLEVGSAISLEHIVYLIQRIGAVR